MRSSLRDGKPPSATFAKAIATLIAYRVGIRGKELQVPTTPA